MGLGISCGAYVVTQVKSLGGAHEYDLVRVVGGLGIISNPWKVKSIQSCKTYTVSAIEIVRESYDSNYSYDDAAAVYRIITHGSEPPKLDSQNQLPF